MLANELELIIKVKPDSNPFTRVNYMFYNPFKSQAGIKNEIKRLLMEGIHKDLLGGLLSKIGLNEQVIDLILTRVNANHTYKIYVGWDSEIKQGILTVRKLKGEIEEERRNG